MHEIQGVNNYMRNGTILSERPARRGRPPAYDRTAAIEALTRTFWNQGFSAASLDALSAAAAMNRPSLYAAFGDKQSMYLAALERYRSDAAAQIGSMLSASPDVRVAVRGLFHDAIEFYLVGDLGPRGCFAICTAGAEAVVSPQMRDALAGVLAMIDTAIEARLAQGVADGQLPPDCDIGGTAMLLGAALHSIAIRARAGAARGSLRALADGATAAVLR